MLIWYFLNACIQNANISILKNLPNKKVPDQQTYESYI